jgi:hypothetical protein
MVSGVPVSIRVFCFILCLLLMLLQHRVPPRLQAAAVVRVRHPFNIKLFSCFISKRVTILPATATDGKSQATLDPAAADDGAFDWDEDPALCVKQSREAVCMHAG